MKVKDRDLVGTRFGKLMVLEPSYSVPYSWFCQCDCGNKKVVRIYDLISGNTKSCGCLKYSGFDKYNKSEKGREFHRQNGKRIGHIYGGVGFIDYNKSEKHKEDVRKNPYFKTERCREIARKNGKLYGTQNLVNFIRSDKGLEHSKRVLTIHNKSEKHRRRVVEYNKSEEHREVARRSIAKTRSLQPTLSQKILSDSLTIEGVENRMEWWVPGVRRIIDIAVLDKKIAIEVDGSSHNGIFCTKEEKVADDILKDQQLQSLGWKVMRITNQEVENKLQTVIERVKQVLK
jgi:very-short-patch-repair endonuclease